MTDVRIATGSVYHPPDEPYPRLLVMRRWPRGVRKGTIDQWERDLAPSSELLESYQRERIGWDEFARRYEAEMSARTGLIDWVLRMATTTGVTLLCGSHPDERCHRRLLAGIVAARAARVGEPKDG